MARRCTPPKPCKGMKGGLFNPFFQNGSDLTGQNGGSSSGIPDNAMLYDDGSPMLYDDGSYMLYD